MNLTASLVLFHNDPDEYIKSIKSFLDGCDGILCIVDNSKVPLVCEFFSHPRVRYFHSAVNLGFGAAHNLAISKFVEVSDFHLIMNPDVSFDQSVLPFLSSYLGLHPNIGVLMPKIVYPDGSIQHLCKLLPTPLNLIFRRFIPFDNIRARINLHYEMHGLPQNKPSLVPTLSGCFLLVRTDLLRLVGGFDERFFMYMEDVDLIRRIGDLAQTIYMPLVEVTHTYAKGSYRNHKLLLYHLKSAALYFVKWGWIFDSIRRQRNKLALKQIKRK